MFHYTQRDGVAPICFLRPVQQQDLSGHCFFAYPLYTRKVKPKSLATNKALYQVSTEDDDNEDYRKDAMKQRELVPFSDYFLASCPDSKKSGRPYLHHR